MNPSEWKISDTRTAAHSTATRRFVVRILGAGSVLLTVGLAATAAPAAAAPAGSGQVNVNVPIGLFNYNSQSNS